MRQWFRSALVQIMACRLFGDKPLSKPLLGYCQLEPQWNWNSFFLALSLLPKYSLFFSNSLVLTSSIDVVFVLSSTKCFIHKNVVCEMAAILSRGRWVNSSKPGDTHTPICMSIHICVGEQAMIGSNNGLSPVQWQTIIWINADPMLNGLRNKVEWN